MHGTGAGENTCENHILAALLQGSPKGCRYLFGITPHITPGVQAFHCESLTPRHRPACSQGQVATHEEILYPALQVPMYACVSV